MSVAVTTREVKEEAAALKQIKNRKKKKNHNPSSLGSKSNQRCIQLLWSRVGKQCLQENLNK